MPKNLPPNDSIHELLGDLQVQFQMWPSLESYIYFLEAWRCWEAGAYVACLVMCRLALEELLRAPLGMAPSDTDQFRLAWSGTFKRLIDDAVASGWCGPEEGADLHWVRRRANSYVHPKPFGGRNPGENAELVRQHIRRWSRLVPETGDSVPLPGMVGDAERALRTVLRFKRSRPTQL
jgi:hypothetical protein